MPRWKSTANLLSVVDDGEVWDAGWMEGNRLVMPPHLPWNLNRPITFADVDIWEVICEQSGLSGVYAAWCPYAEYYVVTDHWSLAAEFSGPHANSELEAYLQTIGMPYPQTDATPLPPEQVSDYFRYRMGAVTDRAV